MEIVLLTVYVLIWPIIVTGVLWTICWAFFKEWSEARKAGRPLI
ncbi:putative transporter small subunit [Arthrobacter oryzae]|nr:putative transporter small subunit [Arthrobacter oryzae]